MIIASCRIGRAARTALVCAALIAAAPASAATRTYSVELRANVTVTTSNVFLSNVVVALPDGLDDVKLLSSPRYGGQLILTAEEIRRRLAFASRHVFRLTGAPNVCIARAGGDRSREIATLFDRQISQIQNVRDGLTYEADFPEKPLMLPGGELTVVLTPPRRKSGTGVIRCDVQADGRTVKTLSVRCRIMRRAAWPVATSHLAVGHRLTAADYNWIDTETSKSPRDEFESKQSLVGLLVKRPVRPGESIRTSDVQMPPLVRKGQHVDLVVARNGFTVTARARAAQDGWIGSRIRVRNLVTNRFVHARVTREGVVEYE